MNVPIEIARAGLTDRYADLIEKESEAEALIRTNVYAYNAEVEHIFNSLSDTSRHNYLFREPIRIGMRDIRADAWTLSLIVEAKSKQLVEYAGKLAEAHAQMAQVKSDLEELYTEAIRNV